MKTRFGPGSDWDGLVVICAANNWNDVKLADRQLAEQLVAHAPVLYVDPPISHLTRLNKRAASTARPRLRLAAPGIARYTPVVAPKPNHRAMVGLTSLMVRRQLRAAVRRLGGDVRAVVSTWLLLDVYGACGEARRVYWWQDDPVGAADYWGWSAARLAQGDERLAQASDLIVTVNEGAAQRWQERGLRAAFVPNGCDAAFFAGVDEVENPTDVDLPRPVAGFVGHLNGRTDLALLEGVSDAGVSLLLVGPKDPSFEPERFARLVNRANVAYVGPQPFEGLRPYLKMIDVGLVPYQLNEFNQWSFPLKTVEYLAAGRPVVATSLPAVRGLQTELVSIADSPALYAELVLRDAGLARDPQLVARRREFAGEHTWARRAQQFANLLAQPA